jgi:hypothetical protein
MMQMDFFCSKDCPDVCKFRVLDKDKFIAEKHYFDKTPFFCSKLKNFFKRESADTLSFYKQDEKIVYADTKSVIKETSKFLEKNAKRRILFLRGSGSLGYMMKYWDKLFSYYENCYFISDNPCDETGIAAHIEDFGICINPPLENLKNVETVFLFGKNAKATNQHLYAYLKNLNKEIVYIDPVKSETSYLSNRYVRINPATDGLLAYFILSELNIVDLEIKREVLLNIIGITEEDANFLKSKIKKGKTAFVIGFGLQRYLNGKNIVSWLNRLAYYTDNVDVLYYSKSSKENLSGIEVDKKHNITICDAYEKLKNDFFDIEVVVASNPLVTYPDINFLRKSFQKNRLILVDTNITDTAQYADFFINVGGMFAQEDIQESYFFDGVINKRERLLKDCISDIDAIKYFAHCLGIDMQMKKVDDLLYSPAKKRRNFNNNKLEIKFPHNEKGLRLITSSHVLYLNSQTFKEDIGNNVFIAFEDAKKLDINDGDLVELFNEKGSLKAFAKISDIVAKGYLMMYKNRKYIDEYPNVLTTSRKTDAEIGISYYDTFVSLRRVL